MQNKYIRYFLAAVVGIALIAVRFLEQDLFYDPLLDYFKHSTRGTLPPIDYIKLNMHVFLRYMINLLLTVLMIKLIFWKQTYVKFTIIFGIIALLVLLPIYAYMLSKNLEVGEMIFFYVRRFLIQPMFLIILIPCFYYQEVQNKKATE